MTINKGFLFNEPDGFPLNQQRLEWMQEAYSAIFDGFAAMIGDNVIMSGCIVAGNTVSDGWVVLNGALYPFKGTSAGVQASILIRETKTPLTFKNGQQKEVQFYKYVEFGIGTGAIAWNSLTRLSSLKNISEHLKDKNDPHDVTKEQVGLGNIPNAKTDDPTVSDSDILATSKMVHNTVEDNIKYFSRDVEDTEILSDTTARPDRGYLEILQVGNFVTLKYHFVVSSGYTGLNIDWLPPAELGSFRHRNIDNIGTAIIEDQTGVPNQPVTTETAIVKIGLRNPVKFFIRANTVATYKLNIFITIQLILQ